MTDDATHGNIGEQIFAQVNKLVDEDGMRRTDAFKKISADTGRREGTVAANYYRVARAQGTTLLSRGGRGRPRGSGNSVDAALKRALDAVEALATVARAQEEELNSLRGQSEQLERLRQMLTK